MPLGGRDGWKPLRPPLSEGCAWPASLPAGLCGGRVGEGPGVFNLQPRPLGTPPPPPGLRWALGKETGETRTWFLHPSLHPFIPPSIHPSIRPFMGPSLLTFLPGAIHSPMPGVCKGLQGPGVTVIMLGQSLTFIGHLLRAGSCDKRFPRVPSFNLHD